MNAQNNRTPIQIILNADNYISEKKVSPGNKETDFFFHRDAAFIQHKERLNTQLLSIKDELSRSPIARCAYLKVVLRKEAWAKSHRPTKKLFTPNLFPSAGGDGIGECFFRVTNQHIGRLINGVSSAEPESRVKLNQQKNKEEPNPTTIRSEVGAIHDILLPDESDRQHFSLKDALEWLNDERSGHFYVIELFQYPETFAAFSQLLKEEQDLFSSLLELLNSIQCGIELFRSSITSGLNKGDNYVFLRPINKDQDLTLQSFFTRGAPSGEESNYCSDAECHGQLLRVLSKHPLVRRVTLPPLLQSLQHSAKQAIKTSSLPIRRSETKYPIVGVIDAGVDSDFGDWIVGKSGVIHESHRNIEHGTFISGLLIGARAAGNSADVAGESDGCDIVDIDIYPSNLVSGAFSSYYPNGFEDFLHELDQAIGQAKQKYGVRVFNFSLNLNIQVHEYQYSTFASLVDVISERHDVIIVISAGNLGGNLRTPWPSEASKVADHLLAHAGNDRVLQPAESVMSICVSAINPPNANGHIAGAPTQFTRQGPGMKVGVKPDVCHYGGSPMRGSPDEGLYSISGNGTILSGMGTSYAAPLVAKTLAALDVKIEGHVPRESLLALLIHGARVPDALDSPQLNTIAKHFVGFGLPANSDNILLNNSHTITLVFHSLLTRKRQLSFDFTWPKSLITPSGKCRGEAFLTLVYKPFIDASYGAEFIRVNIDAHLRQHGGDGSYSGKTNQLFMKSRENDVHFESELIEHGLKWWPIKHYRFSSKKGVGMHSDWRLVVESLLRDGVEFPSGGVPFSAILTITDPKQEKPVFDDMRLWLGANGVRCADVRTAARLRPRF